MRKWNWSTFWSILTIVTVLLGVLNYSLVRRNFSTSPTIATFGSERYHVLPESKLTETFVIMDEQGKKYYVISEEKLRLLGPKLLTGGE